MRPRDARPCPARRATHAEVTSAPHAGLPFAPAFAFLHYKIFRALHAPDPKASEDESKAMV